MAYLIHIVGEQGVGKSLLADDLSTGLHANGKRCMVVDSDLRGYTSRAELLRDTSFDVLIVEHDARPTRESGWLQAGDQVITLELVGA